MPLTPSSLISLIHCPNHASFIIHSACIIAYSYTSPSIAIYCLGASHMCPCMLPHAILYTIKIPFHYLLFSLDFS
jgi:hypothetical protein